MPSTYTVLQSKLAAYSGCFQDKATQAYGPAVTQPGARRADSESLTGAAWPPQASRCQKEAVYKVSLDLSSCTSANN